MFLFSFMPLIFIDFISPLLDAISRHFLRRCHIISVLIFFTFHIFRLLMPYASIRFTTYADIIFLSFHSIFRFHSYFRHYFHAIFIFAIFAFFRYHFTPFAIFDFRVLHAFAIIREA